MTATENRVDGVTGRGAATAGPPGSTAGSTTSAGPATSAGPTTPTTSAEPTTPTEPTTAELLARIEELTRRIEWLEASVADGPPASADLPPEVVLAISAAVAAYLGKRATVRQVHLRSHSTWAKQGRAQVMTSHGIPHGTR